MRLPIEFSYKRNKFEEKLIEFSNKIFSKTKNGIILALFTNIIFIYFFYYKRPFIYIFIFLCLLNLILHIIIFQFIRNK